jgi:phage tail sheath gpL-like
MSDSQGAVINVPNYPLSNLVPGVYFSVTPNPANGGQPIQRTLIIGQCLSSGTYAQHVPVQAYGLADVLAGTGSAQSMLYRMYHRYLKSDPLGDIWLLPLYDDPSATKTEITLTVSGPATAAGTLACMIAGIAVNVPVNNGDTATIIAGNIATYINQVSYMPCNASSSAGVVTLYATNGGQSAGDLDVRFNYYGAAGGQAYPAGVSVAVVTVTQGATNPSSGMSIGLANLAQQPFDFIVCPYNDTMSLNLIETLLDPIVGRWSWSQQIYGGCFTAFNGTVGARGSFAAARNDKFTTCMGYYNAPNPVYEWAADYAAACAASLKADPAVPLGGAGDGVDLTMLPPAIAYQDTFANQSTLLAEGVSTYVVEQGGTVRVQRAVNIYTVNAAGDPDPSYRDPETNYTLMACLRDLLSFLTSNFGRKKLVADGTVISGGSNIVTAQTILQAVIARYTYQAAQGLTQEAAAFAKAAQAVNAGNGVVTLYLPYNVANQLRIIAGNVAFEKT